MLKESTEATFEENKDHSTENVLKDDDSLFEVISCNICKQVFKRQDNLGRHMHNKGTKQKSINCESLLQETAK